MSDLELPDALRDELRTAWHRYLDHIQSLRPARDLNAFRHPFATIERVAPPENGSPPAARRLAGC